MSQSTASLAEHLKNFSAVNLNADTAAAALQENLRQFGPVIQSRFGAFRDALHYLLPLKSFPTRYLVLGLGNWSILLTDMRGANCNVEGYAISRRTLCNTIGLSAQQERRELHLFENGQDVREIQSLRDGDRWYYREKGLPQPFEDPAEVRPRKKEDRLSVPSLQRYFKIYTDLDLPDWENTRFTPILGLERSLKDLRVQVIHFETVEDF